MATSAPLTFQAGVELPMDTQQDDVVLQQAQGTSARHFSYMEVSAFSMAFSFSSLKLLPAGVCRRRDVQSAVKAQP